MKYLKKTYLILTLVTTVELELLTWFFTCMSSSPVKEVLPILLIPFVLIAIFNWFWFTELDTHKQIKEKDSIVFTNKNKSYDSEPF